jgi:hypothetical protein
MVLPEALAKAVLGDKVGQVAGGQRDLCFAFFTLSQNLGRKNGSGLPSPSSTYTKRNGKEKGVRF